MDKLEIITFLKECVYTASRESFPETGLVRGEALQLEAERWLESMEAQLESDDLRGEDTRLDALGLAIADAGYTWTPAMRAAYDGHSSPSAPCTPTCHNK